MTYLQQRHRIDNDNVCRIVMWVEISNNLVLSEESAMQFSH